MTTKQESVFGVDPRLIPVSGHNPNDRIAGTFVGKRLFISGGTGFLGKVLIEKLLRKCPDIGGIIMIVREKRGKTARTRVEEMFKGPLFEKLVAMRGMDKILSKVTVVAGDTAEESLGLSQRDREICRTANVIVHSAASVRFDEGLKKAVILNTMGTKSMLDLAKECPNLELFMHISTAYCHPEQSVLDEVTYKPPADPMQILDIIQNNDEDTINVLTPKLLGHYPNTYAFSKALAEALAEEAMETLPVMILRPSIVIPILKDPLPGWTDNINGPIGLLVGAGKGVVRTMHGNENDNGDFIPVDCAVNALLAAAWDYMANGCHHRVINLTTSAELHLTWKMLLETGKLLVHTEVPFDWVIWYPGGCMTDNIWLHRLRLVFCHWLPALFIDFILLCIGRKPILTRIHRRIYKGMDVLKYYTCNRWDFKSDKVQELRTKLTAEERLDYKVDSEDFDIYQYFKMGCIAARRYILKEKDEDVPRAKRHVQMMFYVELFFKILIYGYILSYLLKILPYILSVLQ